MLSGAKNASSGWGIENVLLLLAKIRFFVMAGTSPGMTS
jgi:hypothetical protein